MAKASLQTYANVTVKVEPAYSGYVRIYKALLGTNDYEYVSTTYSSYTFQVPVEMEVTIILYKVKLEAVAGSGYVFSRWVIDGQEIRNPVVEFTVTKNVTATVYFTSTITIVPTPTPPGAAVLLSVGVNRYGWGSVKVFVDGAYRATVYRGDFFTVASGSRIKLAASPSAGYVFDYFMVDSTKYTTPEIEFTITKDTAATAYFKEAPPTVTYVYVEVGVEPYGGGYANVYVNDYFRAMVTGTYAFKVEKGSRIRCEAYPYPGYSFDKWIVNSTESKSSAIEFVADRDLKAKAYFKGAPPAKQYKLSINVSPAWKGSVAIYVNNVYKTSTSSSYSLTLNEGDVISLSATPSSGYVFDKYVYNGTTHTDRTLSFTMTKDVTVTAYFREAVAPPAPKQYTLSVSVSPAGKGSVAVYVNNAYKTTTSNSYSVVLNEGDAVKLSATPSSGYNFEKYVYNGTTYTATELSFTMTKNVTVTAYFKEAAPPPPAPPTPPTVTPTPFEWGALMQTLFPIIIVFFILMLVVSLFR